MDTCSEPMSYLQDALSKEVTLLNLGGKSGGLRVKRKPNKDGDVHIPAFVRNMDKITDNKVDITAIAQKITSSPTLGKHITSINLSTNGQLNLCLNKVSITETIICNVMSKRRGYGISPNNVNNDPYLLNGCVNCDDSQELSSLDCLRMIITLGHVKNLLSANGKSTEIIPFVIPKDKAQSPLEVLVLFNELTTRTELESECIQGIEEALQKNRFVMKYVESKSSPEASFTKLNDQISEQHLCFDSQMYSGDSNFGQVSITSSLVNKLCSLELATRHNKGHLFHIFHVTSHRKLYTSQQHGFVWQALSQKSISQVYLSLGEITAHSNQQMQQLTIYDLLRIRENQLRSAYLLKYGDIVCGPGWDDSIRSVAVATLKLQIMSASQNNQVKIDVSEKSQDFRQATFIMYNCARLAKLFQNYEDSVHQGHYPELPEIDKIDFSLLREMDEWKLLLCYVMQFPSVVRDTVHDLSVRNGSLNISVNRICCFLLDLSKDFSSYYGRTHVLGEPRPHLFPTMFARLYLMKAIQQVFHNCLALLDIRPLTQM